MAPPPDSRNLARAGWSIVRPSDSPEPGSNPGVAPEFDALGAQLVSQVATSWTSKHQFTIKQLGFDAQSVFHYECIFSCPSNELPVPSFVLSTRWALVVPSPGADPRLLYSFEEGDLRHEWALVKDSQGQYFASTGQQFSSLGNSCFEDYMDRLVHEKEQVRDRGVDLRTQFENTRLEKPPAHSEVSSEEEEDSLSDVPSGKGVDMTLDEVEALVDTSCAMTEKGDEGESSLASVMREALKAAGLYCDKVEPPSSLAALLASIFDAADEETVGELPHCEVARLLSATLPGFGLELWDIHLLMTSAQENDDGFIECKPFIQAAPEIIQALRKRRIAYRNRGLPGVAIPQEAVKHCFTDEVTVTANQLTKVFEQMTAEDPSCGKWECRDHRKQSKEHDHHAGNRDLHMANPRLSLANIGEMENALVGIKRRHCQDCIASLPERLSPQETMRLMQMLPEDEDGYIMTDELVEHLEHLRTDAMLNALVESDVLSLRTHLVLRFRHLGLGEDGKLSLWTIKDALLSADQVCLTRLQVHLLLCLAVPDAFGFVNIAEFLGMCCVIIPHMFDAKLFVDTAEHLVLEHAENMRKAENEELAALGAARVMTGNDGEEAQQTIEVDPETVERTLQQVLTLNDDLHKNPPALPPEKVYEILCINEKEIQSTQLSAFEITGFAAEMQMDEDGLVPYVEHIKKWVPIMFEQRKNRLLGRYMEVGCYETLGLDAPDLEKFETMFPLLPYTVNGGQGQKGSQRRSSRLRERRESFGSAMGNSFSSIRNSKEGAVDSKGSPISKKNLALRRQSTGGVGIREGSKRRISGEAENIKNKEPPPGRGYERRKARISALAAAEEAEQNVGRHL